MKILILSDIHGNWPALEAVLANESNWQALFFLGDVVEYGPDPKPCLDFLRQHADFYVRGNHDHAIAYAADCGCGGDFREMSVATRQWHRTVLEEKELGFLRRMPIIQSTIVGLARDRGGEACYAVWEKGKLTLMRVDYDASTTVARLEQSPLDKNIVAQLREVLTKQ